MSKISQKDIKELTTRAKCSSAAYLSPKEGKEAFEALGISHRLFLSSGSTQVYVGAYANGDLDVSFRGTEADQVEDILADLNISLHDYICGKVHKGFYYALEELYEPLVAAVQKYRTEGRKIIVNGHSLGGSLAILFATRLAIEEELQSTELTTFGQPRVGDKKFINKVESIFCENYKRVVNDLDIVPKLPPKFKLGYDHSDELYLLDEDGTLQKKDSMFLYLHQFAEFAKDIFEGHDESGDWNLINAAKSNLKEYADDHAIDKYVQQLQKNHFESSERTL